MSHAATTFADPIVQNRVALGTPRVVAEGIGFCWFPDLRALPTGEVLLVHGLSADADDNLVEGAMVLVSTDRGETWDLNYQIAQRIHIPIPRPDGAIAGPGTFLFSAPRGQFREFVSDYLAFLDGGRKYTMEPEAARVGGLPRDVEPSGHREGMSVFYPCGDAVDLGDEVISTAYLRYDGDERYTNVALASTDFGRTWRYLADVAGPAAAPEADEGPCEAALVQLADGDLMCVMRTNGRSWHKSPLCRSYSADGGRTWSPTDRLPAWGVFPSLRRLDNGRLVLATGRPGIQLWVSADPRGESWEMIDVLAHHNAVLPSPHRIGRSFARADKDEGDEQTTSYTVLLEVAPGRLLLVYDRIPFGWSPVPVDSDERSRIYLLPIEIALA